MNLKFAFLLGFLLIVAHVPSWGQPAMDPKSILLLTAGGLSWLWISVKGIPMARLPWVFTLPFGWLLITAVWSPSPFLGMQRVLWAIAAVGIGTLLSEKKTFESFLYGFLAGTAIHSALIFLQWIPSVRSWLPSSLGIDAFQGIGRGLFHNTNMAALPLMLMVTWIALDQWPSTKRMTWHLLWVLPTLSLTQSRWSAAVCAGILAYAFMRDFLENHPSWGAAPQLCLGVLLALAWSLTAQRFGWVLPTFGVFIAWGPRGQKSLAPEEHIPQYPIFAGLILAILFGVSALAPKNQPSEAFRSHVQGGTSSSPGDVSLSQRLSYYRCATFAILDNPIGGQGLGSARTLYPFYVEKDRPAIEVAYGDFQRPNNLHSEPLELLMEGGLMLLMLVAFGYWADRFTPLRFERITLIVPLAVFAILDFPLHNPPGVVWLLLCLIPSPDLATESRHTGWGTRVFSCALGLILMGLARNQTYCAQNQPKLEHQFFGLKAPEATHLATCALWNTFPFSVGLFDLVEKSVVQAASANPNQKYVHELDQLLHKDPWDHHLLLAQAQLARKLGDSSSASHYLERYRLVAPRDPNRYLRLARDASAQGNLVAVDLLLNEARRQPGFNETHQAESEIIRQSNLK